jgi:hypothetical protein
MAKGRGHEAFCDCRVCSPSDLPIDAPKVTFQLSEDEKRRFQALCQTKGMTMSKLLRQKVQLMICKDEERKYLR